MPFIILAAGLYLLIIAFSVNIPRSFVNVCLYRVMPIVLGLVLLAHAVKSLGWLALL